MAEPPKKINPPEYLRARKQWLVWRLETVKGRLTKPPYSPHTLAKCDAGDRASWADFEHAKKIAERHGFSGVGFALAPDDDLSGIDLDHCRDASTGEIDAWAREIIALKESYVEVSPSGTGLRIFARGKVGSATKSNPAGVEIYGGGRYLTFTGQRIEGAPDEIRAAPFTLHKLQQRVESFRSKGKDAGAVAVVAKPPASGDNFFRAVNDLAMQNLDVWVPAAFETARYENGTGAWRISSADLDRDLEEDLSIAPEGIVDFGLHDMGDAREGRRTPIDVVMNYPEGLIDGKNEGETTAMDAGLWLCKTLGADPASLGWREREQENLADVFDDGFDSDDPLLVAESARMEKCSEVKIIETLGAPFDPWARYIVPDFPSYVLPDAVARFVENSAANIGCDPNGLAMCVLSACSGALDHRFSLKMKRHGSFLASPRLWILLVGDPSTKKSPMMRAAVAPLRRIDNEAHDRFELMKEAFGDEMEQPKPPRLLAGDTTIEALGQILAGQHRGILIHRDEFAGWIGSMEKYSGGRGGAADRGFWLQSYDGGTFHVDRIGRGQTRIKNLSVSLLGGIQPERLAELHGLTSDGLLQRFSPVMLAASRYGEDKALGRVERDYEQAVEALHDASPTRLTMTEDAIDAMAELHRELHDLEQATHGVYAGFQGFVGKMAGLSGSLALILHLMDAPERNAGLPVEKRTVEDAAKLTLQFLVPHAFEFYRTAEATTNGDRLARIASWILTSGMTRITASDLTRNIALFRGKRVAEIGDMVSPMVAGGWLYPEADGPRVAAWRVNPQVHNLFAERAREEERRKAALAKVMGAKKVTK